MVEFAQLEIVAQAVESVPFEFGVEMARDGDRIYVRIIEFKLVFFRDAAYEAHVEICVVRHKHGVAGKIQKRLHRVALRRRAGDHFVGDAGEFGYIFGDMRSGVDESIERFGDDTAAVFYGAYFGYCAMDGRKPGGLDIEHGERAFGKAHVFVPFEPVYRARGVVDKIPFYAVERLDRGFGFFERGHYLGERLDVAVVGHGDGGHAPSRGGRHPVCGIAERVVGGKRGVKMQLHALFGSGIGL